MNIDSSYFTKGRRLITNATNGRTPTPQNTAVCFSLQTYIDDYTPVFLNKVLGREVAEKLLDADESDVEMKAIFDGIKEPMADFVMYHILRYSGQRATMDGLVELKSGNKIVSPATYQMGIWNEMVDGLRLFCERFPGVRVDQCLLTKITSCWI